MAIITKARMQQLRGKYNQLNKEALLPGEFAICDDHNPIVRTNAGYKELLTEDNAEYFENKVVEIDNAISSTNKAIADMEQATSDNTQRVDNAIQQIQTKIGIDDTQSSILTTYSSNKIDNFISDINDSLGDKIDTTGDVSEAVVSTLGKIPDTRLLPSVGDKIKVMFAKTIKYFQDLKTIAFTGNYEDLLNKPSIPTVTNNLLATESGTALDAVQGKVINDKIGSTDISAIGDGSVTGALSTLNSNMNLFGVSTLLDNWYGTHNVETTVTLVDSIDKYDLIIIACGFQGAGNPDGANKILPVSRVKKSAVGNPFVLGNCGSCYYKNNTTLGITPLNNMNWDIYGVRFSNKQYN